MQTEASRLKEEGRIINKDRKSIIRKIGLIFLGVVLTLTFFSKTINSFLLPEVECAAPVSGYLSWTVYSSGEARAVDRVKVFAHGNWSVKDVMVDTSYEVTKGFDLAVIDEEDIKLSVMALEVELLRMKNELESYKNAYEEIDISAYEEDVQLAGRQVQREEENYLSVKELYESGAESYRNLKDAETRLEDAKAAYGRKIAALNKEKEKNAKLKDEYDRNIRLKEMEIELKTLEYQRLTADMPEGGIIKSPIDGVVRSVNVEKGSECMPGQTMFELTAKDSQFTVQFKLNAEKAELLKEGNRVELEMEGDRDAQLYGYVLRKEILQGERMYLYTSNIVSSDQLSRIQDGQTVKVSSNKGSEAFHFIVPNSSIIELGDRYFVFVLKKRDGILGEEYYVSRQEVRLLERDALRSAISSLESGVQVVTFSSKVLEDGMQVRLSE